MDERCYDDDDVVVVFGVVSLCAYVLVIASVCACVSRCVSLAHANSGRSCVSVENVRSDGAKRANGQAGGRDASTRVCLFVCVWLVSPLARAGKEEKCSELIQGCIPHRRAKYMIHMQCAHQHIYTARA